jgi:hypothetical protein
MIPINPDDDFQRRCMADNLVTFLYDANHFAVTFREVIESSVAHIYLSALPSVHKTSKIAEVFKPRFPSLARITAEGIQVQPRPLLELRGHTDFVRSVGFSPGHPPSPTPLLGYGHNTTITR